MGWTPGTSGLGLGLPPNDPASGHPGALPPGNPPTQAQSRLIPGAPMIPSMAPSGGNGVTTSLPAGSLLGRDMPPPPLTPATQALPQSPNPVFPSFNGGLAGAGSPTLPPQPVVPASPLPPGRSLGALRPNRGANVIRLGLAALFLLSFLGIAGYFLKDTISGYLAGSETTDVTPIPEPTVAPQAPAAGSASTAGTLSTPRSLDGSEPDSLQKPKAPGPNVSATDPLAPQNEETTTPTIPKAQPATPAEIASVKPAIPEPDPASTGMTPPPAVAQGLPGEKLLEVAPVTPGITPRIPEAAPGAPTPRQSQIGDLDEKPSEDVPPEAQPALQALKSFLAASTAQERSAYILGPDYMKPLLDRYYSRNNDGPITIDHITFGRYDKQPELGTGAHCIFHIESKTWEYPVPAMLEEQPDGWKVDWLTFIELKDRKLEDFFKTYQEGKAMFHVGIFRQHYFGDEVPNRDQKDAFSIGLPRPNPFRAPVFIAKEASLARQLHDRLPWEVHVWAIVELEWKKLGSQQWVELVSMPQMHWYSLPASPRPISAQEKPALDAPAGSSAPSSPPTIKKASPVGDEFPPGIRRSPATRTR